MDNLQLTKILRYPQHLRGALRKRFRSEYLSQLIQQPGKGLTHRDIQVGNIVLIEGKGRGRTFWSMAMVMQVYPGRDGCVRVVRLKTTLGEMTRPVQQVYPLEVRTQVVVPAEKVQQSLEDLKSISLLLRKTVKTKSGRQVKFPSTFLD
jgi:hypothetical protein